MLKYSLLGLILLPLYVGAVPSSAIRTTNKVDICSTKTSTVRLVPTSVKNAVFKRDGVLANFVGICDGPRGCEVDHRVSLELGGSNDISNLIVKPYFGVCNMAQKDILENKLHKLVCSSMLSVQQAQEYLYSDWPTAYKTYVNSAGCSS